MAPGNPVGYVPVFDGEVPRTFTGYAREAISGGELVFASGADGVVSSGANSFATTDLLFATGASGAQYFGVALANAGSNEAVTVATRGAVILKTNGTVTPSFPVLTDGNQSVANAGSVAGNLAHQRIVGRAVTGAASGGYVIVDLR